MRRSTGFQRLMSFSILILSIASGTHATNHSWLFTSTTEGWTLINMQNSIIDIPNGWLVLNPGNDPRILSPSLNMPPSSINYLKIGIDNKGLDPNGRVYFSNTALPANEQRSVGFTNQPGIGFNNVVVWLGGIPAWLPSQGNIDQVRIDPVQNGSGGLDDVLIDYIFIRDDIHAPLQPSSLVASPAGYTNGPITVTFQSNDPSDISGVGPDVYGSGVELFKYRVDPQADQNLPPNTFNPATGLATGSVTYSPGQLAQGPNQFHVYCRDRVQQYSIDAQVTLYFDSQQPSVPGAPFISPALTNTNSYSVSWSGSSDAHSGVAGYFWHVNGSSESFSASPALNSIPLPALQPGLNTFYVRCVDNAGNSSGTSQATFTFDNNPPSIPTGLAASPGINNINQFSFSWDQSSDDVSGVAGYTWQVNNGLETFTSNTSLPVSGYAPVNGLNTMRVRSLDVAGNYSQYASIQFRLSCCIGLTGNIDCDPQDAVDIGDLTRLVDYLFVSFAPLCCPLEANIDGDSGCNVDIADLTQLVDFLFISFTPTAPCNYSCE